MQNIKNIIFDLGNVILNISYQATIDAFADLGIKDFDKIFSKHNQNTIADDVETGNISDQDFINYLLAKCKTGTTQAQVIHAWNAIILDFPIRRLQLLQQLQLHYNLYLLSNTNSIHEKFYNQLLMNTHGIPSIGVFFDKIYLSHKIGLRKPNPASWQLIMDQNNLNPQHTLFIDDSLQHIEAAKLLGLQTIHIADGMSMEADVFKHK
jgi:glucose-1-phosphatase